MIRPQLPLNALRAFEASARHLSFTRAAVELCVTQAAVSHQVKSLEAQLNLTLFKRLPRGLMLTSEGETLLPVLSTSFDHIAQMLERLAGGQYRDMLTVGAVGTFAVGWLLPRLADFRGKHPLIDLRLSTNNNRVDVAAEGLDYAIRFACSMRRCRYCACRRLPGSCTRRRTCCSRPCCVPIAPMNGRSGFTQRDWRRRPRHRKASCSIRRWQ
jgi:DNA-binding transcriptional LysR family regulator